MMMMVVGCIFC